MTVARYVSPNGTALGGKGLQPDDRVLVFPGEGGDRDAILERGLESPAGTPAPRAGRRSPDWRAAAGGSPPRRFSSRSCLWRSGWRSTSSPALAPRAAPRPSAGATPILRTRLTVSSHPAGDPPPRSAGPAGSRPARGRHHRRSRQRPGRRRAGGRWREPVAGAVLPMLAGSAAAAETLSRSRKGSPAAPADGAPGFPAVRPGPGLILGRRTDAEIRATLAETSTRCLTQPASTTTWARWRRPTAASCGWWQRSSRGAASSSWTAGRRT